MNYRRIWKIAVTVALLTMVPVAFLDKSAPWLIAIPPILGGMWIAILELLSLRDGPRQTQQDK
jgi:hypothetical protein